MRSDNVKKVSDSCRKLMNESLHLDNLHVTREGKDIVKGVSLSVAPGEVHVLMGPNGSGKSTLANTLMGHPDYAVSDGKIELDGEDITAAPVHERAKKGLFLSMQYPPEIPGLTVFNFLRSAVNAVRGEKMSVLAFRDRLKEKMEELKMDPSFTRRHLNAGFSGGEKKRAEILQMAMLEPKYAILDETDSGLDVDALKIVSDGINRLRGPERGILLITHYTRILNHVKPDVVHVLKDGRIVKTGGPELAEKIEHEGFDAL